MKKDIFLAILSGIFLTISFPNFNLWLFAWFGFIPLFFAIQIAPKSRTFFLAYITGIIFWLGTIYWLIHVTLAGLILLVLYLSLYFGFFGLFFKLWTVDCACLPARQGLWTIVIPAAWVFLEYLRSTLFTGFPWALLGYSQYLNLPMIQIADITGVWGVSFLVMMVNVGIYSVIARTPSVARGTKQSRKNKIASSLALLAPRNDMFIAIALLVFSLIYGFYKLSLHPGLHTLHPVKISVIQASIPQQQKWDENFKDAILERYEALTKEAAEDNPDLIIWPETSVPGILEEDPVLLPAISDLAKSIGIPILIGAVTATPDYYYNSALLISAEGGILQQYDKLHLVPFGEYVPLERYFPFLRDLIGIPIGNFTAGHEHTVFKLNKLYEPKKPDKLNTNFSVLICFEDTLPGLSRRFVKDGADFLVNITNDAWFMESSAPYQHLQASVFMAVENRRPVVRAANTGISCFIDQKGRIYGKVGIDNKDIFVIGYKTEELKISNEK
ncbi:MAG: apolipoprotein N-acyltransferase [Candidatus Omnitrophica bacterium]|nr:apolipoprotein N-acyltransferase [Candidatus Omnitrophota bacterium]